ARLHGHRARGATFGRRGLPRPAHGRHDDDARAPQGAGLARHQAPAERQDQRLDAERLSAIGYPAWDSLSFMKRVAFLALLMACGSSSSAGSRDPIEAPPPSNPFAPAIDAKRIVVELDYQRGAEPYTGTSVAFGDTWRLFRTNAEKLFEGTGKTLEVPTTLDGMERLDDVQGTQFSSES